MPKAVCPKCGAEGECVHFAGMLHDGVSYDEYSFQCSRCGFGNIIFDSVPREDPSALVRFPIGHLGNRCPYCGKCASKEAKEEFHAKVERALELLAANSILGKEMEEFIFAKARENFDNLSPALQQIVIAKLKEWGLIN